MGADGREGAKRNEREEEEKEEKGKGKKRRGGSFVESTTILKIDPGTLLMDGN